MGTNFLDQDKPALYAAVMAPPTTTPTDHDLIERMRRLNAATMEQLERDLENDSRWPALGNPWVYLASVSVSMLVGVLIGFAAR